MDASSKVWVQLSPLIDDQEEESGLVRFVFPLDLETQYSIGSISSESVSLVLPDKIETEDGKDEERLPTIKSTLIVNARGEVYLERPEGGVADVAVNGQRIAIGSRMPMAIGSTVSFGPWQYVYTHCKARYNGDERQMGIETHQCIVCSQCRDGVFVLPCGRNICGSCRNAVIAQLTPRRIEIRSANVPHWPRLNCRPPIRGRPPNGRVLFYLTNTSPTGTRVTTADAKAALTSERGDQLAKTLSAMQELNRRRPMCDDCQDTRGLFSSRDYDFCERCQQMVCPVCVLRRHRDHELKQRVERLRDVDIVEQNLERMATTLEAVERLEKEAESNRENKRAINDGGPRANAMSEHLEQLRRISEQCRQHLASAQNRKRALARDWDETSRELASSFDRYVRQAREQAQFIDRLRNGEISFTLSSTADTNESQASAATQSSPTSSTSSTPTTIA